MKRGHYILIGGAALFVIGIALIIIGALPIAQKFQEETSITTDVQLPAGQLKTVSFEVTNATKPLTAVVTANDPVQINAVLIDPEGRPSINSTFSEKTFLETDPVIEGTYSLVVTNKDRAGTTVNIIIGHIPGVTKGDANIELFGSIITGAGVAIIGVIVMIVGIVIVILEARKDQGQPPTSGVQKA